MAQELKHIDISDNPELLRIVEEVLSSNEPQVLQREHVDVAILRPIKKVKKPRVPRGKPFTKDDPLWDLVGIGQSGLGDVAANKHKYLADAYANLHE